MPPWACYELSGQLYLGVLTPTFASKHPTLDRGQLARDHPHRLVVLRFDVAVALRRHLARSTRRYNAKLHHCSQPGFLSFPPLEMLSW